MRSAVVVSMSLAALSGCQEMDTFVRDARDSLTAASATAALEPTRGGTVSGTVKFEQSRDRVALSGMVSGLKPNSEVGFHIHENGDCSSGDGMSAGGHFNPQGKPHAHPTNPDRHAGDLPMLRADAYGNAIVAGNVDIITVSPGPNGIVGKALIVHVQPDDFKTQPTGNAGARAACGVIRKS